MTSAKTTNLFGRRLARPVRDFLLGLTLFTVVAVTCLAGAPDCGGLISNPAQARLFEVEPVAEDLAVAFALSQAGAASMPSLSQQFMALSSLALAFASVFAFNLWFARQLRRVHAVERRRQ